METIALRNRDDLRANHFVARLKLEDGRTILVNFGDQRRNPELLLKEGQDVTIVGRVGTISGRRVLFAENVEVEGRNVRLQREENASNQRQRTSARGGNAVFAGVVEDVTTIHLNNESGETKQFIQMALESGDVALLDMGEEVTPEALGISEGERITIRGKRDQISGRKLIRATELMVNGEEVDLESAKNEGTRSRERQ